MKKKKLFVTNSICLFLWMIVISRSKNLHSFIQILHITESDLEVKQHSVDHDKVQWTLKQTVLLLRLHRVLFFTTTRSTVEKNKQTNCLH